jgi:hypothetical protein
MPEPEYENDEIGINPDDESDAAFGPAGTEASTENALLYREPAPPTISVRRAGSKREQPPTPPGVEEWDFGRLFATFQVNWQATSPHYFLGRRARRAALINWSVDDLKSVEATSRIYEDIARRCPGPPPRDTAGNPIAGARLCPCASRYGADPLVWQNLPCPAENLQAFRHFTQLIRDLHVPAENHVDVMMVIEVVKLLIYEARCDQDLQDEGRMFDLQVGQLNQATGVAYYNKVTPVALSTQGSLAARRMKIYKDLLAGKADRVDAKRKDAKVMAQLGNANANQNMVAAMTELNRRNIERRRSMQETAQVNRIDVDEIDDSDDVDEIILPVRETRQLPAPRMAVELSDIAE